MDRSAEHTVEQTLAELEQRLSAARSSETWLLLGDALARLDELGPYSTDGRPWTEVVQEAYEKFGYGSVSVGHLQKVRRVRNFVRKGLKALDLPITDADVAATQMSALEVAERLYTLDPRRGAKALVACIRGERKFVDMRREYDAYVEENADRLPSKRATWLKKRRSNSVSDAKIVEEIVLAELTTLFGSAGSAVFRPFEPAKSSDFLRATDFGFHIIDAAGERTLGVELINAEALSSRDVVGLVSQIEFQAGFFDFYWVFVRADENKVAWLAAILDEVRIDRVGLLRISDDQAEVTRRPSFSPPTPDRRHLLKLRR